MPRQPKIEHGKRTTYVRGCRCERCCEANTQYGKDLKERKRRGQPSLASVTTIGRSAVQPERDPDTPGPVETAVIKEMKGLSAANKQPGLVQSIIAMAQILDNPGAVTTHPSAQHRLMTGLDKLWGASVGRKGTLADVAKMAQRGPAPEKAAK